MFKLFKNLAAKSTEVKPVVEKFMVPESMTLEQVLVAMMALMAQESINQHYMGQLYNHVVKKKLAEAAGYKDAKEWFSKHLVDLSQASLTVYGAVAEAFSEEVSRRFGITCLSLLLRYEKAADLEADRQEPGNTVIEVPGDNGQVASKPSRSAAWRRCAGRFRASASRAPASRCPWARWSWASGTTRP